MTSSVLNGTTTTQEAPSDTLIQEAYNRLCEGKVEEGMNGLISGLQERRAILGEKWPTYVEPCRGHPLRELLHHDPFTRRAFLKPRGYAGDAVLLDFVYGCEEGWPLPPQTSDLGKQIFAYTTHSSACDGVRARRGFIADLLDRVAEEIPRPHILSIASGHVREALLSCAVKRKKLGRFVALDADRESLLEVDRCYSSWGIETVPATVRQVMTTNLQLGLFDLVYSTGLFDYFAQPAGQRLTRSMFQLLRPRGRLVLANFLPGILEVGYMETYMDWKLIYRTRQEMLDLLQSIPQADIREIKIFAEESQHIIFLQVVRN